ncbi:unnamed protein product [Allacma fusca]|uniref:Uncharacterized protein n=1 Tax=Allacma fusca TaxID=39272 RepID=A0A8J2KEI2_9HEXA|nr:unnamed protein product [Allacma fusca]
MPEIFSKVTKGKLRRLRFRFPRVKLTKENIKQACTLPKKFCGTCSLREGSAVVIVIIQLLSGTALAVSVLMLEKYPKEIDDWWESKLKNDFKPAFGKDLKDYARSFMHGEGRDDNLEGSFEEEINTCLTTLASINSRQVGALYRNKL